MAADLGVELPQLSVLLEVLDQHLDRQAALHLELAVNSGLGFLQHLRQSVRDDLDPPARQAAEFLQHIAIEYGSCPVEVAAHQMRGCAGARACTAPADRLCR